MKNIKHLRINAICLHFMVLLLLSLTCYAQEQKTLKVDYSKIEKFVKSNDNQFEQLIARFENGDTTLTLEDIANIYYGSFYSTEYSYIDASKSLEDKMKERIMQMLSSFAKKNLSNPQHLWICFSKHQFVLRKRALAKMFFLRESFRY